MCLEMWVERAGRTGAFLECPGWGYGISLIEDLLVLMEGHMLLCQSVTSCWGSGRSPQTTCEAFKELMDRSLQVDHSAQGFWQKPYMCVTCRDKPAVRGSLQLLTLALTAESATPEPSKARRHWHPDSLLNNAVRVQGRNMIKIAIITGIPMVLYRFQTCFILTSLHPGHLFLSLTEVE